MRILLKLRSRLPIDETDVAYILEDLHRGKSLIPPHAIPNKPLLTRWDPGQPLNAANCVVLDVVELKKHLEGLQNGKTADEVWGEEVSQLMKRRQVEAREWMAKIMD